MYPATLCVVIVAALAILPGLPAMSIEGNGKTLTGESRLYDVTFTIQANEDY